MTISFQEFKSGQSLPPEPQAGKGHLTQAFPAPKRRGVYRNIVKRAFDVMAVVMAAPVVVPLVLALAAAVARDGGRPFYTQMRVGKGGRRFKMWKLRSMVCDADARMEEYLSLIHI